MGVLPTHLQEHAQFPVGGLAWDSLTRASLCIYTSVQLRSRAAGQLDYASQERVTKTRYFNRQTALSTVRGQGFQINSSSTTLSLCSRHYCSYYIRPHPHETGTDRQRSDYVAAPLFLNGLSVGLTERSLSPTYDTHVALGLGTPAHPLAANCHSYLQH
jgi:hypothetical protein